MSAVLKPSKSRSVKSRVSKEEWGLRADVLPRLRLPDPGGRLRGGMENVLEMSKQAGDEAAKQFERPGRPSTHKDWPALLRLLDRKDSNYAS